MESTATSMACIIHKVSPLFPSPSPLAFFLSPDLAKSPKTAAMQANSQSRVNLLSTGAKQPPPLRPLLFCSARSIKTKIQNGNQISIFFMQDSVYRFPWQPLLLCRV